jgi:SAM-dependent methyltransferase
MRFQRLWVAIAIACAPLGPSWAQPSSREFADPVAEVNGFIRDNNFQAGRGIDDYKQRLRIGVTWPASTTTAGHAFLRDVDGWTRDMRILDAGAGKGVFLRAVRDRIRAQGRAAPQLVGVAAAPAEGGEPGLRDGVRHHIGWLGTDGETERELGLGTFDRIVDVYGAAHYTPAFDKMVASYLGLLKPGGRAYIHLEMKARYSRMQLGPSAPWRAITNVEGPAGEPAEDIVTWLEAGSGYRVELHGWRESYAPNWESTFATLVLEKTGKSVKVP